MATATANDLDLIYGSTTIHLTAGDYAVLDYYPRTAPIGDPAITESIGLTLMGSDFADLQSNLQAIEKALWQAREYQQTGIGDRVYLSFTPTGYDTTTGVYRSEILDGQLDHSPDTMRFQWGGKRIDPTLILTRRNYWEGPEAQVPLSNGNGTNNTAGLNVYTCNDGAGTSPTKRNNYFDIDGADVTGDLPAPLKVQIIPGSAPWGQMQLVNNVHADPANLVYWREGEAATGAADVGLNVYSGDHAGQFSLTGGVSRSVSWSAQALSPYANSDCISFAAVVKCSTGVWVTPYITLGTQKFRGPKSYIASAPLPRLRQLGMMRNPLRTPLTFQSAYIGFDVMASGDVTFLIDFLQTQPVDYALFQDEKVIFPNASTVILDGIGGFSYLMQSDAITRVLNPRSTLMVVPGRDQRITFLSDTLNDDNWQRGGYGAFKVWYRPRRLSL